MEFITQITLSDSFDSILVIVDRFSKMAVFIPTMYSIPSLYLEHLFIKNILWNNGLPSRIVSDRGSLFVSSFWTNLCQRLNISKDLSTAYHPETDGQTERVNQILEQYLWIDPQFDSVHITQDTPAGKLATKLQSVQKDVKREPEFSINRFKRTSNQLDPPKNCLKDSWVLFPILKKVITHAYHLKLPLKWKYIHPVFHISFLEPVKTSKIPNFNQEPPPPIIIEEEEWEVSLILDSKIKRGKLWYLVEWKGFSQDPERSTWEPAKNLKNGPERLKDFHSLYPEKPGPNSSRD
ncbi:hypothetical protein O181_004554 [Austropuccinia psidii MF-1]|uniref:Uncharacterized protein n=1 Tax=Austropuccinia psidii MF-1 TaxID=1389203 RepID=A0A9Q3BGF4_9BASI|nr:hypothetical protein [Austropuccinia psidii MF-1]